MLAIRTDNTNWTDETLIGQFDNGDVLLEVETAPTYEYESINEKAVLFIQRVYPSQFGVEVTYMELCATRNLLNMYPEAGSLAELYELAIIELQDAVIELDGGTA